jgi:hypothetical protein
MALLFILTIALLIAMVGSLPIWPHSKNWSYFPVGGVGLVLLFILVALFLRHGGMH